jgi:hypothetical protein
MDGLVYVVDRRAVRAAALVVPVAVTARTLPLGEADRPAQTAVTDRTQAVLGLVFSAVDTDCDHPSMLALHGMPVAATLMTWGPPR